MGKLISKTQAWKRVGGLKGCAIGGTALVTAAYCGWQIYSHQKRKRKLRSNLAYDPQVDDIDFGIDKLLANAEKRFNDVLVRKLQDIDYVPRPHIETLLNEKLNKVFSKSDRFGLILFGSKGIGKSTVAYKFLIDHFAGPVKWWENINNNNNTTTNANTQGVTYKCPCFTVWVSIALDDCKSETDIANAIASNILGGAVGGQLDNILFGLREKLLPFNTNLLVYLHISSMPGVTQDNQTHPLLHLEQLIRTIANAPNIGFLIEISKCWCPRLSQESAFPKIKMNYLTNEEEQEALQSYGLNSQRTNNSWGRYRLISDIKDNIYDDTLNDRMSTLTSCLNQYDSNGRILVWLKQMSRRGGGTDAARELPNNLNDKEKELIDVLIDNGFLEKNRARTLYIDGDGYDLEAVERAS